MKSHALLNQPAWRVGVVCVLGAAALTAGVYAAVVRPVQASRSHAAQVAAQADATAAQAESLRSQLATVGQRHAATLETLERQRIDLGDASQLNRRIVTLIELARRRGLDVVQLQPGGQEPAEHYNLLGLQLEAIATPEQHAEFLDRLHAEFPDLSVVALDLRDARGPQARPRAVYRMVWFTSLAGTGADDPSATATATVAVPAGP